MISHLKTGLIFLYHQKMINIFKILKIRNILCYVGKVKNVIFQEWCKNIFNVDLIQVETL